MRPEVPAPAMGAEYVRICPVCAARRPAADSQCECGTLLIGVDLTRIGSAPAQVTPAVTEAVMAAAPVATGPDIAGAVCPHADCGATNPPGLDHCVYCGRSLAPAPISPVAGNAGLYNLPAALAANFVIDRVLPAAGAEAELMLLKGRKTGVRVMAKLYRPGVAPKGDVLERVGRVAHAHVVRLLAHGVSDGVAYEVMEYCSGGSLRQMMAAGPLPSPRLRLVLAEIAEAVAALHAVRVIHRDLKPENVLVRRPDPLDLVLTDFGIASLQDATQLFTGTARTAGYGAPESLTGVLDEAADYWSLGVILVEMLQGQHPYAGLSEPVVAHRLATTGIDTGAIADPGWRLLCRGLLQREPGRRWGIAEIRRWLADDPTLPVPADNAGSLGQAYRIEGELCHSRTELAAAFSRHWPAARKDLARGQFENWVRQELKDHDLVRYLQDLKERGGSPDLHLFLLIRHLSPAIPPSWRGVPLAPAALLAQAALASREADANVGTDAADWLQSLFADRVGEQWPAGAFPDLERLLATWGRTRAAFGEVWRQAEAGLADWRRQRVTRGEAIPDFDALVFGDGAFLRQPAPGRLLADLLLVTEQPGYAAELRSRALAKAAALLEHSPWLEALCQASEADDSLGLAARVAVLHLLPQAQEASESGQRRIEDQRRTQADVLSRLHLRVEDALAALKDASDDLGLVLAEPGRQRLTESIEHFLALSNEARGLVQTAESGSNGAWRTLARAEPVVLGMRDRLDQWQSASRINALWRHPQVGNAAAAVLLVVLLTAPRLLPWLLAGPALFAGWRLWVVAHHRGAIRRLAAGLPSRVPKAVPP